jgi:nucleosome binding factor SPN SPT16 subunit
MTREELIAQNFDLKRITSAERRRHAAVERVFVQSLDELQTALDDVRILYVQTIAPKPVPSERRS